MADYLLFGVLQWARVSSPFEVIAADDIISGWMENMLDLHGGLGRSVPARGNGQAFSRPPVTSTSIAVVLFIISASPASTMIRMSGSVPDGLMTIRPS